MPTGGEATAAIDAIRAVMARKRLTQNDLAELWGMRQPNVSKITTGVRELKAEHVEAVLDLAETEDERVPLLRFLGRYDPRDERGRQDLSVLGIREALEALRVRWLWLDAIETDVTDEDIENALEWLVTGGEEAAQVIKDLAGRMVAKRRSLGRAKAAGRQQRA